MEDSTNPSLGGHVIQCHYLWGYSKNYWGVFRVIAPFKASHRKKAQKSTMVLLKALATIPGIIINVMNMITNTIMITTVKTVIMTL